MYLSTIGLRPGRLTGRGLAANVFALGAVSLATDVSAEMVTAVLPVYFVLTLQLGPAVYGVLDGLYTGATALLRVAGGYLADRTRGRKAVAAAGYGISAVAKLGLLAAGGAVPAVAAVLVADRAGKGLRTAPRDALITLSTPEPLLGRAFGVHRTMDSLGAFAGPLVALAVLGLAGGATADGFDALFTVSFCVAAAGLVILWAAVRDHREPAPATARVSVAAALGLLREPAVRRLVLAAGVLGLATIGDGFVYLLLTRANDIATGWFPLMAVATNLVYLLLAAPLGALADRRGRLPVVLGGYGALLAVYLVLGGLLSGLLTGPVAVVAALAGYGGFYAATDGVLMALAGPVLPAALRTTGLALVQSAQALAYLASSIGFGLAWGTLGPRPAIWLAAAVTGGAILVTLTVLRRPR
ncbi:MFS transporter [Nonomuraea sp. NPDC050536]|uniref:MFS transporter n=1 Tax=Nonomuraea sp. NPDC050536 TaxID=3364366 RepID=UPI0037C503BF